MRHFGNDIQIKFFYYLVFNLLVVNTVKHVVNGNANLNCLMFAGLACP